MVELLPREPGPHVPWLVAVEAQQPPAPPPLPLPSSSAVSNPRCCLDSAGERFWQMQVPRPSMLQTRMTGGGPT